MNAYTLYVIQCQKFYKVGITKTLEKRVKEISSGTPFDYVLVDAIPFDSLSDAKTAEKIAHEHLTELGWHYRYEWFTGDADVIQEICRIAQDVATDRNRLRSDRLKQKAQHFLKIVKPEVVHEMTKIPKSRIQELLHGSKMLNSEAKKIQTLWENLA